MTRLHSSSDDSSVSDDYLQYRVDGISVVFDVSFGLDETQSVIHLLTQHRDENQLHLSVRNARSVCDPSDDISAHERRKYLLLTSPFISDCPKQSRSVPEHFASLDLSELHLSSPLKVHYSRSTMTTRPSGESSSRPPIHTPPSRPIQLQRSMKLQA